MDILELQKALMENVSNYESNHGIEIDANTGVIKLFEEVGEFSEAFLTYSGKSRSVKFESEEKSHEELGKELADVFGMTILLADRLNIDLLGHLQNKWIGNETAKSA